MKKKFWHQFKPSIQEVIEPLSSEKIEADHAHVTKPQRRFLLQFLGRLSKGRDALIEGAKTNGQQ